MNSSSVRPSTTVVPATATAISSTVAPIPVVSDQRKPPVVVQHAITGADGTALSTTAAAVIATTAAASTTSDTAEESETTEASAADAALANAAASAK